LSPGKKRLKPPLIRESENRPCCTGGGFLRMLFPGMGIVTADEEGEGDDGPREGECRDITDALTFWISGILDVVTLMRGGSGLVCLAGGGKTNMGWSRVTLT
jgi:hypothetical protein